MRCSQPQLALSHPAPQRETRSFLPQQKRRQPNASRTKAAVRTALPSGFAKQTEKDGEDHGIELARIPEIHSLSPLELTMDFDALPFPLQAVILHPDLYDRLRATTSRNTWAKYMKLLDEYEANAGRSNSTRHTLSADQHKHIDIYVRERLNEFICAGTILSTIQS